tara:strand:- start:314 stop:949 length:636 start_codon:yes stop_codon:yes gene_type:complete
MITTTKKEIAWVIIAILIMGFIISFSLTPTYSPKVLLIAAIIILTSVITKKIAGDFFNIRVEHKVLEFKRWSYYTRSHFKNPIPMGLILPFFFSIISLGMIKPFTLLQFTSENLMKKRIRRRRREWEYKRTEINDSDIAFTAAWGFFALLILALVATLLKQPELAKYSIYYGVWNMIPFGTFDGIKLFFGSPLNWALLAITYIISLIVVLI